MNIVVLGAGRVGRAMAIDLARDPRFHVHVVDRDADSLAALGTLQGIAAEHAVALRPRLRCGGLLRRLTLL